MPPAYFRLLLHLSAASIWQYVGLIFDIRTINGGYQSRLLMSCNDPFAILYFLFELLVFSKKPLYIFRFVIKSIAQLFDKVKELRGFRLMS